jgi:hypothetical protein
VECGGYEQCYRLWEHGIKGDAQVAIDGDRLAGGVIHYIYLCAC